MDNMTEVADRVRQLVWSHDRERALEAIFGGVMGVGFSFITFGFVFGIGWFFGLLFARSVGLYAWQFGIIVAAIFLITSIWSAWRKVDPFAGLAPPSDEQMLLTYFSHWSDDFFYASPRHSIAGTAVILIAGPANIFKAIGAWRSRFAIDSTIINDAARLLALCSDSHPAKEVRRPATAILLKRLALIKFVRNEETVDLVLTEKGAKLLGKRRKPKPTS